LSASKSAAYWSSRIGNTPDAYAELEGALRDQQIRTLSHANDHAQFGIGQVLLELAHEVRHGLPQP